MSIPEIVASVLIVFATFITLATAITMWRAPDALTRVNLLSQLTGVAIPLLLVAKMTIDFSHDGFDFFVVIQVLLTLFGLWIMGSVASYYMARSIYGVTVTDVRHALRDKGQIPPQ